MAKTATAKTDSEESKVTPAMVRFVDAVAKEFLGDGAAAGKVKLPNGTIRMYVQDDPETVVLVSSLAGALHQIRDWSTIG